MQRALRAQSGELRVDLGDGAARDARQLLPRGQIRRVRIEGRGGPLQRRRGEDPLPPGHVAQVGQVGGDADRHPDLLGPRAARHDETDDEGRRAVAHEHVELEDEEVVEQAVEDEQTGPPRVGARPRVTATDRRLALDLQADAEHDRQQPDEFAVGRQGEHVLEGDGGEGSRRLVGHVTDVGGDAGEDPDVRQESAEDRQASEHVERRQAAGSSGRLRWRAGRRAGSRGVGRARLGGRRCRRCRQVRARTHSSHAPSVGRATRPQNRPSDHRGGSAISRSAGFRDLGESDATAKGGVECVNEPTV